MPKSSLSFSTCSLNLPSSAAYCSLNDIIPSSAWLSSSHRHILLLLVSIAIIHVVPLHRLQFLSPSTHPRLHDAAQGAERIIFRPFRCKGYRTHELRPSTAFLRDGFLGSNPKAVISGQETGFC